MTKRITPRRRAGYVVKVETVIGELNAGGLHATIHHELRAANAECRAYRKAFPASSYRVVAVLRD